MNYKNLFLRQSYLDSYDAYKATLGKAAVTPAVWDYVVLTASNESQAESYRSQIDYRIKQGVLPQKTKYVVIPDRDGKRIGSGGATFGVMRYIRQREESFDNLRIMVIHSGGSSKRVPQYSACGKLFSPVPRKLPDGRRSTLFDEFIIGMSGVADRIEAGMLVLSGDVLLLFNQLQIDFNSCDAAALSIKESAETGKEHGVFLRSPDGYVERFLHKLPVETLKDRGAVDKSGKVNIDTGAIMLSPTLLGDLYGMVDTDEKFDKYVNDTVCLSFYADFVYPLAVGSTLEEFYNEAPEGEINPQLLEARERIWDILHKYKLKLISFSPASFLHFGTSKELLSLVTENIEDYRFLDWSRTVNSGREDLTCAVYNSYVDKSAVVGSSSYLENSCIEENVTIGENCIISGVTLKDIIVPDNVILHGIKLKNGKFTVRMLGINDNPKEKFFLGKPIDCDLWSKPLFTACDTVEDAARATLLGKKGEYSLSSSFEQADAGEIIPWQDKLSDRITAQKLISAIADRVPAADLGNFVITSRIKKYLISIADRSEFSLKIRIYYYAAKLSGDETLLKKCFEILRNNTLENSLERIRFNPNNKIVKSESVTNLPVRVNWGGGWSDTPPYCNENGGVVLNAAITLNGRKPIRVTVKKLNENKFVLSSTDSGAIGEFTDIKKLQDCCNPRDPFALHKASLIACGVIPYEGGNSVDEICRNMGGGMYINTEVLNIPKGSGLGTSSILAGACVKSIFDILGITAEQNELFNRVLCVEQIMSTGGGWQDQAGGLVPGIKTVTSGVGTAQNINVESAKISKATLKELSERFFLIYTGQRRLARNLLRDIVGNYIGADRDTLSVLYRIQRLAVLMRFELEKGNIEGFCELLNEHWELSKRMDGGCTNTCIDQIFNSIDDLVDGRMICGAGGGGFLQVVLKKGVTAAQLERRLWDVFADSGVRVCNCEFYM